MITKSDQTGIPLPYPTGVLLPDHTEVPKPDPTGVTNSDPTGITKPDPTAWFLPKFYWGSKTRSYKDHKAWS